MAQKKKLTRREIVTVTYDECHAVTKSNYQCEGCGKDLCADCAFFWFNDPFTGDGNGDYPPKCCEACNAIAVEYSEATQAILEKAYSAVESARDEWQSRCKKEKH